MKFIIALILVCLCFTGCSEKIDRITVPEEQSIETVEDTSKTDDGTVYQDSKSEEDHSEQTQTSNEETYVKENIERWNGYADETTITTYVKDCDQDNQFAYYTCPKTGIYEFTVQESDYVDWEVYVLDEDIRDLYNEPIRRLPELEEPLLDGPGTLEIKQGYVVYIRFITDTTDDDEYWENATITFSLQT